MSTRTTVRAVVFTSPAHDLVAARGTFSPTTSTLVVGESESVLVDAQYIASDIAALGDLIESTGTKLTTIYVTHAHADHYLGIGALLERFPGARPLATPGVVEAIRATRDEQAGQWSAMFGDAAVRPTVLPEPMVGDVIDRGSRAARHRGGSGRHPAEHRAPRAGDRHRRRRRRHLQPDPRDARPERP
jgi:glyoxylase-like metal-dependent hydrolase (beta-lactamase superfamily II)